ncbi:MAG: hypothetical protein KKB88_04465 [Nanoarchaeota archaeon]|nr:hypothetical protein [Nanoarchaeota archaeon]
MHEGEIIAISPKGKGRHPEYVTVLIKSGDALKTYKDNQKWLIILDDLPINKIKRGKCEFEMSGNDSIMNLRQTENKIIKNRSRNYVKTFSQLTLLQLESTLNDFCSGHGVFATQVFQLKCEGNPLYDALVHYKS